MEISIQNNEELLFKIYDFKRAVCVLERNLGLDVKSKV